MQEVDINMLPILIFVLIAAGHYLSGQWLLANPGEMAINWFGYDITVHIVVVAAALLALVLLVSLMAILLWKLLTWPKRRRARKQHHTLQAGLKHLTTGVTALAMGDEAAAHAALKKATLALPNEPLPKLLTAQLLQRQGKHADARAQFKALMDHTATAPLATRRLIEEHVNAREWLEASKLAEEARKEAPKDRWLVLTLLDLYARDGNSADMLALTEGWGWQSPLTKEERHRYAALAHYLSATRERNARKKEQSLRHAVGYASDFMPAVIDFASAIHAEGQTRRARKWLRAAWQQSPNLLLIQPILSTIADESPRAQLRLLKPFLKGELGVAHHLLAAHQAFATEEFERAKISVEASLACEETKAACTLMAQIEKKLRGVDAENGWLARAVDAPASEAWVCDHCGTLHTAWTPHCSHCQHFDSLRYTRPEARITSIELATTAT
jgi:HemY protein